MALGDPSAAGEVFAHEADLAPEDAYAVEEVVADEAEDTSAAEEVVAVEEALAAAQENTSAAEEVFALAEALALAAAAAVQSETVAFGRYVCDTAHTQLPFPLPLRGAEGPPFPAVVEVGRHRGRGLCW